MDRCKNKQECLGFYALVAYLPGPLAGFVETLRADLAPGCIVRAHLTILPARPLADPDSALKILRLTTSKLPALEVRFDQIEIFESTDVVYLSVGAPFDIIRGLHASLNTGCLGFREPWDYHPHITLAQDVETDSAAASARSRWKEYQGPRSVRIDQLTLVQNRPEGWTDVEIFELV